MAPSTLGAFLRAFTFGHVAAGQRLVVDLDSFAGEVHGYQKHGASYGYTREVGYHPILALSARGREVPRVRDRTGVANTQRGIKRFTQELLTRFARAGHTGKIETRADSGYENHALWQLPDERGVEFSIAVKVSKTVPGLIDHIGEDAWQNVADYPQGGEAQAAETSYKNSG